MSRRRSLVAALLVVSALAAAGPALSTAQTLPAAGSARLLDVPYLPQTPDLCGGAAVAMVLRYWGERRIDAQDFAGLVDRSAAGIRTDVLSADVRRRGWQALTIDAAVDASARWMHEQIDRGRPVIALVQVSPNRYHYVVIVAWTPEHVIAHDPARAPFQVLARADFDRAWASAGRWALLVLPPETRGRQAEAPLPLPTRDSDESSPASDCAVLVQAMTARARGGELETADPRRPRPGRSRRARAPGTARAPGRARSRARVSTRR